MRFSNSYRLETIRKKNEKKYSVLESVSLILKIVALLLLIILFRYFYIAILVWLASIAVNFFKRNLVFKYVYSIENGILTVTREYNAQRSVVLRKLDIIRDIKSVEFGETELKYYDIPSETPITVSTRDGDSFSLAADDFFYGLIDFLKRSST